MFADIFDEVKDYLKIHGGEDDERFTFRKRSEHIRRVFTWVKRLTEDFTEEINSDALLTAALFHDIGYGKSVGSHAENSAVIFRGYAESKGYDKTQSDFIEYLIRNHSNKEMLSSTDTPLELILLLEADLLDETGALRIMWITMSSTSASAPAQSYKESYQNLLEYTHEDLDTNPMRTAKAKEFWENKQVLIREFLKQLEYDLDIK